MISLIVLERKRKEKAELEFRKASASGDVAKLKELQPWVDINAVGSLSKKSAAHWAAEHGHNEVLKLLINLGIDLELKDETGRTASDLAKNAETALLFETVSCAKTSILAAKKFFPTIDAYATPKDEFIAFAKKIKSSLDTYMTSLRKLWIDSGRKEYIDWVETKNPGDNERLDQAQILSDNASMGIAKMYTVLKIRYLLEQSIKDNKQIGNCGSASAVSFTYLSSCFDKLNHPAKEAIEIFEYSNEAASAHHTCVILNRDKNSDIKRPETWGKDALIIDPDNDRVYFICCVKDYYKDTDFKNKNFYGEKNKIVDSNQEPKFKPSVLSVSLYKDAIASAKRACVAQLKKRGIECPFQPLSINEPAMNTCVTSIARPNYSSP